MKDDDWKILRQSITLTCKDAEEIRDWDAGPPLLKGDKEAASPPPFSGARTFPGDEASVNEVRGYIIKILAEKHNTTYEYAERVAHNWRLGTGWVFRSLPLKRFSEIFGDDIGPHLASDVAQAKKKEKADGRAKLMADWRKTTGPRNCRGALSPASFYHHESAKPSSSCWNDWFIIDLSMLPHYSFGCVMPQALLSYLHGANVSACHGFLAHLSTLLLAACVTSCATFLPSEAFYDCLRIPGVLVVCSFFMAPK